jgi:uncharacterized protein YecA (UPF0149 family)
MTTIDYHEHDHDCCDHDHDDHTHAYQVNEGGTYLRAMPKLGRNDPCSCGSGKKYKKCCLTL